MCFRRSFSGHAGASDGPGTGLEDPAGLPEGTLCANKTGETDTCQHDAAIVFGPEKDYILCVMSDGLEGEQEGEDAALLIRDISRTVYEFSGTGRGINVWFYQDLTEEMHASKKRLC